MKINLSEKIVRYWSFFGYRIGVLEFVWNSPYPEIRTSHFLPMLNEVLSYLPTDLNPNKSSYSMFTNSILNYYLREDYSIYCAILLGISICRVTLVGSSKNQETNAEIEQLAKSALRMISDSVISDKEAVFEFLLANKDVFSNDIHKGIELLIDFSGSQLNRPSYNKTIDEQTPYVFISYSSLDIADACNLRTLLENNHIKCWMAPDSIPSGSDYGECIPAAIENCKLFLLVLSEKSQKSKWVPKELDCAITNNKIIIPFHTDNSQLQSAFNFRLTNVQRIEAYQKLDKAYLELVYRIKAIYEI